MSYWKRSRDISITSIFYENMLYSVSGFEKPNVDMKQHRNGRLCRAALLMALFRLGRFGVVDPIRMHQTFALDADHATRGDGNVGSLD